MEVNVLSFLPKKTFIFIEDQLRDNLFMNLNLTILSKILNVPLKNMSRYKTGSRSIPLEIFINLIKIRNKEISDFQDKIVIKVGKIGNKIKIGPMMTINDEWVYTSELIRGDGCLAKGNNESYHVIFVNKSQTLINFVKDFFIKIGINYENIKLSNQKGASYLVINSEFLSYFFNSFFKIPFGKKNKLNLPPFIKDNKNFTISAIRGIFDAEGCITMNHVNNSSRRVVISISDKEYLSQIKIFLYNLNIHSNIYVNKRDYGNDIYNLIIGDMESIIRFSRIIKPLHKERSEKLYFLIKSYKRFRLSFRIVAPKILLLLTDQNMKRKQISHSLNIPMRKIGGFLGSLLNKKFIKVADKISTNRGSWFIYCITEEGKDYLNSYSKDFF